MNEEFLDYWQSPANMPFPDSHKDLELWCNNAFLAGAAAMREKAAEVAGGPFDREIQPLSYYVSGRLDAADAIRKLEV